METRHQFVTKTRQNKALFGGYENAESKAGKGIYVCDLIFDTEEVDGSSPFGPTNPFNHLDSNANPRRMGAIPESQAGGSGHAIGYSGISGCREAMRYRPEWKTSGSRLSYLYCSTSPTRMTWSPPSY